MVGPETEGKIEIEWTEPFGQEWHQHPSRSASVPRFRIHSDDSGNFMMDIIEWIAC